MHREYHVRKFLVISVTQFAGGLLLKMLKYCEAILNDSRKIAAEENFPPALILMLILNQTLTLPGGAIFLGGNFPDTILNIFEYSHVKENVES